MLIIYLCLLYALGGGSITWALEYRLSQHVIPHSYDIVFRPYLQATDGAKQFTFDGQVNITLHATVENIQNITLHKDYIEILDTVLYDDKGNELEHLSTDQLVYETITDKLTVPLRTPLVPLVNYTLYFKYTGQIRSGLAGVFRGTYDNESWYAVTQMQRIDARTGFPCFDEPQLKATFRMRISRPKEFTSFFNTRLMGTKFESDDLYTDYFEESPPMSTYLVAFLVGDYVAQGDNDYKIIMHKMYNNKTAFSQEVARKTLLAYDNYTQLPYKTLGNTLMQNAGSVRFPHNGMENWGLVIYQDDVLAHEPGYTDGWSNKEYTITIVVHETAHMWFGNSVTFKWWSYFWLNEGFARYYQYFLAHEIYPEYELDKQFVVNQIHLIFGTDATNSTQPLTSPEESISSPSQIAYKFSGITYAKGAAIIRMISNLMGKTNFDNAMRDYLKENHLKNTVPEDLFIHWRRHWPGQNDIDVNEIFHDWFEQPGFPMVRISTTETGRYMLTQERFLLDDKDGSDPSLKYTIPITYTTNRLMDFDNLYPKYYLRKITKMLIFGDSNADEWIILNLQQSNYHRVFYEAPLLERLRKAFTAYNHSGIHVINRAHLVDDLFTYGRLGMLGYDVVFEFMEYLAQEVEYLPWNPAFKALDTISQRLTLDQHKQFGKFLFEILNAVYKKLGFEKPNDTVLDVYNRNKVISWLCKYHHSECNEKAQKMLATAVASSQNISPDFRETVYCAACRDGTFTYYLMLANLYKSVTLASERDKILRAMGCTRNFVEYHYAYILSDNVPLASKTSAINALYSQTPENVMPVYYAVTDAPENLAKILGSWSTTASVISGITNYFTTEEQLNIYKEFIETKGHLFGTSVSTLQNAVKTVEKNLAWSEKHLGKLFHYLDNRNGAGSINGMLSLVTGLVLVVLNIKW